MLYSTIPVYFLLLGVAICAPELMQNEPDPQEQPHNVQDTQAVHQGLLAKRSPHYNFGLGKRAYSYVSEYKRLPVYNFGLGKRSRPYSMGLGKRSIDDSQYDDDANVDPALAELFQQYDDAGMEAKRARPYSFGLGKRFASDETSEEKRARMYDFGLGKRLPLYNFGLGKRARNYNFGLGKRLNSKFNFGLGKRERDSSMHRFNFGLGKRAADDISAEYGDNYSEYN